VGELPLFTGSALAAVDAKGRVALPPFVLAALQRRTGCATIIVGAHEDSPCVAAFDRAEAAALNSELERRRLRDEASGDAPASHHSRARRLFGLSEEVALDEKGRIVLPAFLRRKGGIESTALFVGGGGSVEIWNPEIARRGDDEALRELAEYRLAERSARATTITKSKRRSVKES
jgi:DNA-binding transcriptional regulator/RsmH inhibitor MraZ